MGRRVSLVSVLLLSTAFGSCASTGQVARGLTEPAKLADFLVPEGRMAGVSRSGEQSVDAKKLTSLSAQDATRWTRCGATAASQATYQVETSKSDLVLRVVAFAKPWNAYCAFSPGRSEVAHPVLDLDAAFEDKNFARAWRGHYLAEVSGELTEQNRDLALGLLRATVARMPADLPTHIAEQEWFPETYVDASSAQIVMSETIPGVKAAALVAKTKCEGGSAKIFAIPFASAEEAKTALDGYQQRELENFSEVEPYTVQELKGAKVVAETGTSLVLLSGTHLVGVTGLKAGTNCQEVMDELAIRSAPAAAAP